MKLFGKELPFRKKNFVTRPGAPMFSTAALTGGYEGGFYGSSSESQKSTIVASCLRIIASAYTEAPVKSVLLDGSEAASQSNAAQFMASPCSGVEGFAPVTARQFWQARVRSGLFTGNFYALKLRNGSGKLIGLYPCEMDSVQPDLNSMRTDILGATVTIGGQQFKVPRSDLLHLRSGQSRDAACLGRGPVQDLAEMISTDIGAVRFIRDMARLPILRMLVTWGGVDDPTKEQADMLRANLMDPSKLNTAIVPKETKAEKIGLNPQEAGVETMTDLPEERICAVLGVPLIMAQLGAGMGATTYNNLKEAREQFVQGTVVPMWLDDAEQLSNQIVPEFENPVRSALVFDESNIKALQEDVSEAHERARLNFMAGGLTLNEFRADVGMPEADIFGEMFAWQLQLGGASTADAAIKQFALQSEVLGSKRRAE